MNLHMEKLQDYLSSHFSVSAPADISSVWEFIYLTYMEWNPIHTEAIKTHFRDLEIVLEALSRSHCDLLFEKVCDLCESFEKEAFLDGLYVGAKLTAELYALDNA